MKGKKTGGRVAGTPNKNTAELQTLIRGALSAVGGQAYLEEQAVKNPVAFLSLLKSILPKNVNIGGQEDNELVIRIRGYVADGN